MRLLRRLLVLTAIAAGVLAFYNFYADNREVEERARRMACGGEPGPCSAALTRLERSPIRQSFRFRVRGKMVDVACTRAYVLLGPMDCRRS